MAAFITEHMLTIILVLAGLFSLFWLSQFQKDLGAKWYAILILAILVPVLGILSGIVLGSFENILCGTTGTNMTIFGTIFFLPLFCLLGAKLFKKDPKMVCDIFALCIICGAFFARMNCLFAGCCLGKCIGNSAVRWPTREAELVFYVVMAVIVARKVTKHRFDGTCYPLFMLCYGVFRFITELLRESEYLLFGKLDVYLVWSVVCFAIGLWLYTALKKKAARTGSGKKRKTKA